jgi:2-dehydropantoate 2-reductase
MKIAILGCGNIGCLLLGYLSASGCDVLGIVKEERIRFFKKGVVIKKNGKKIRTAVMVAKQLRRNVDYAFIATKTKDVHNVILSNKQFLENACIITIQNGFKTDEIIQRIFPKKQIINAILMCGARQKRYFEIDHYCGKTIIIGVKEPGLEEDLGVIKKNLSKHFNVLISRDIDKEKIAKILLNISFSVPILLSISMEKAIRDQKLSQLTHRLVSEAFEVVSGLGWQIDAVPFKTSSALKRLLEIQAQDSESVFAKEMLHSPIIKFLSKKNLEQEWEEIPFINGFISESSKNIGLSAPLNEMITNCAYVRQTRRKPFKRNEFLALFAPFFNQK